MCSLFPKSDTYGFIACGCYLVTSLNWTLRLNPCVCRSVRIQEQTHKRHMCRKSLDYLLTLYKLVLDSEHNWADLCIQSTFPNWTPRVSFAVLFNYFS